MNYEKQKKRAILKYIKKYKRNILIGVVVISILFTVIIYNKYFNSKTTYTVLNGYVEKTTDSLGIILKNENVVELNNKEVAIPLIEQNKRIAKGDIIAIYKNQQYEEYLNAVEELDKTIQTLIVDLPVSYSTDVTSLDMQIEELTKEVQKETSYIKMQEYKSKIDDLSYKKVLILGERSPEGSKVRELISKREQIEKTRTSLEANNILAPVSGVATYKIDGLENLIGIDEILNYDIPKFEDIISKYKANSISDFGIKIIDNYKAYILIKEAKSENDIYIEIGKKYSLKFSEKDVDALNAKLIKIIEGDGYNYILFQIENGIENLIDLRTISAEVVWKKVNGMAVPKTAIKENKEKNYNYVTLVYGTQYIEVPIKIVIESDNICIVDNLTREEKDGLGITTTYILELYDKLLID